ncbi:MAG: transglycosylase [Candidatus Dadabacteria bacterium]|nr:MAG: transglycosylase [Candidatus Dadabacteria bacterium]
MRPKVTVGIIAVAVILWAVFFMQHKPEWTEENSLVKSRPPGLTDDLDSKSLITALSQSLTYLKQLPEDKIFHFDGNKISAKKLYLSLKDFKEKLETFGLTEKFFKYVKENFVFYRSAAREVLITGYYEPLLKASKAPDKRYKYPIYKTPPDLIKIRLSDFFKNTRQNNLPDEIRGRVTSTGEFVPYYTREEIDFKHALKGMGLELAWVDNLVDLFFLHIQGSGVLVFQDGTRLRVNYAEQNGHPYRSIGKFLVEKGIFTSEGASMQAIKNYLREHPKEVRTVLSHNPSYIFFRTVTEGPLGHLELPLTPYRSVALDRRIFPPAAPVFLISEKPEITPDGTIVGWKKFSRFVFNQDTGGAIRGPGRLDLFCGAGEEAEITAGHLRQSGALYFILKKQKTM